MAGCCVVGGSLPDRYRRMVLQGRTSLTTGVKQSAGCTWNGNARSALQYAETEGTECFCKDT